MLPQTIRAETSPQAITKVTRLFNGSPADVLGELFQNARRAGARAIAVSLSGEAGARRLVVRDDGFGIADPSAVLSLGRSGWAAPTSEAEDPAGMGFFSLAGLDVTVRSWSEAAGRGWRARIAGDAWEGASAVEIAADAIDGGTELAVAIPADWDKSIDTAIRDAARYLPIPATLDGEMLPREEFLANALLKEDWRGTQIGVVLDGRRWGDFEARVNFHGVVARCELPFVTEGARTWRVRVNVAETGGLHLVLPARKELVQGPALDALREAAERAIYRAIALQQRHRLSFAQWSRAAALGVALPEADAELHAWLPATADQGHARGGERVRDDMLIVAESNPEITQPAARALRGRWPEGLTPVGADSRFVGYAWYDALPRLEQFGFRVTRGDEDWRVCDDDCDPPENGRVDSVTLEAVLVRDGKTEDLSLPAEVAIDLAPNGCCDLDEARIYVARDAAITPEALVDLLDHAIFLSSDDRDADSWESQHDRFLVEAAELARTILLDAEAALIARIRDVARVKFWFVPRDRCVDITVDDCEVAVRVAPPSAAT